jgi:hypothetical protein
VAGIHRVSINNIYRTYRPVPAWVEDWPDHYAWFIWLNHKDGFDRQALKEMPNLEEKIGVPLTEREANAVVNQLNKRSNQLRTFASRGYESTGLPKENKKGKRPRA